MKQFETKLTVRIYDTKLIESLNTIFKLNKNRYQTKNQLIVELLELGIKDKMKDFPTLPDSPAGASAKSRPSLSKKTIRRQCSSNSKKCFRICTHTTSSISRGCWRI